MFTISKNMKLMYTRNSKNFGNIANRFDNLKSFLKVGLVLASGKIITWNFETFNHDPKIMKLAMQKKEKTM